MSLYALSLSASEVVSTLSEKYPAESFPWMHPFKQLHVTENITAPSLNTCVLRLWVCHILLPYSRDANRPGGILQPVNPQPSQTNKQDRVGDLAFCLLSHLVKHMKEGERTLGKRVNVSSLQV